MKFLTSRSASLTFGNDLALRTTRPLRNASFGLSSYAAGGSRARSSSCCQGRGHLGGVAPANWLDRQGGWGWSGSVRARRARRAEKRMPTQAVRSLGILFALAGAALLPRLPGAPAQGRKPEPSLSASP